MSILRRLYDPLNRSVALFVDGPNVLREEFDVDLDDVRIAGEQFGRPAMRRLYLDEHAPSGLIQAAEARGFEVIVTSSDVDVRLSVDLTRAAVTDKADIIAIVSRDADFKPAIEVANDHGQQTVVVAPGVDGRSDALRNAATTQITLGEHREGDTAAYSRGQYQGETAHDAKTGNITHQANQSQDQSVAEQAESHTNMSEDADSKVDSESNAETTDDTPTFVGYDN